MKEQYVRTAMLLGEDGVECLQKKRVAVFGVGGVGGHVIEALARSGIGAIDLIDNDRVNESNINRQIIATYDSLGKYKTEVMKERILSIQPSCKVTTYQCFYLPETRERIPFKEYDYIVDAIDTVTAKIDLIVTANKEDIPIMSSMGTGNKLKPTMLEIADIYETSECPLAKVMRRELKKRKIKKLKVVYSKEKAIIPLSLIGEMEKEDVKSENSKRQTPGSVAFVPAVAGLIIASEVIKDLIL